MRIPGNSKSLSRRGGNMPPMLLLSPGNQKRTGNLFYTPPKVFNVLKDFKAAGDYVAIADAAMGGASTTLTSASNPFHTTDIGKIVQVQGAGAAGVNLFSTITGYNNAGSVTLADANASGGNISGKFAEFGSDDTLVFQAAINAAVAAGGGSVYAPTGSYFISQLNMAGIAASVELIGDGPNSTRMFPRHISAYTGATGHVLDLTGSYFVKLRRFQLGAYYGLPKPKTGIFLAQIASGVSNRVEFDEIYLSGQYAVSTLYNYGVPSSVIRASDFYNYTAGAGTQNCLQMTATNAGSLSSAYATVTSGFCSTSNWLYDECEFHKFAGAGANNDAITLDQVSNVLMQSGVISGGCTQYVTFKNGCSYVTFDNVTMETESQPVTPTNAYNLAASSTLDGFAAPNTSYIISGAVWAGSGTIQTVKGGQQLQFNSAAAMTAGNTYFLGASASDTTEANVGYVFTEKGVLCNMYVRLTVAPSAGKTVTTTLRLNGGSVALTKAIVDANTTGQDQAHYVNVAVGDYINPQVVMGAAAATTRGQVTVTFLPMG